MAAQDSNQSYLSRLTPWSKSSTAAPSSKDKEAAAPEPSPLQQQKGADHAVNHRHRLSLRRYPRDCPPLRPQWFHAVDVPKRKPNPAGAMKNEKPLGAPKKYAAFSKIDSKAIEVAFQKMLEQEDVALKDKLVQQRGDTTQLKKEDVAAPDNKPNASLGQDDKRHIKVPVNEDYLFDVDIDERELAPAYWQGPVYDVRRGTWFYQDGNVQRPCDENLAAQLEEGYLKVKAWKLPSVQTTQTKPRSASQPRARPVSWTSGQQPSATTTQSISAKPSTPDLRQSAGQQTDGASPSVPSETDQNDQPPNTQRLFGAHMNSVVTYQDATTAWLITDDFMSRMNYAVYARFTAGGHFGGMKLTRGYIQAARKPETKDAQTQESKTSGEKKDEKGDEATTESDTNNRPSTSETIRLSLQRQMSTLLEDPSREDPERQEELARQQEEREIEDDYRETEGDDQGREIEHLILVTHGIGQRLGLRLESVNFVHDVNTLRKTLKSVYAESPDLRALNAELGDSEHVNSRVQVLPICWRHLLDFPKQSLKHNREEHDIADTDFDEEQYPSLEDITPDGVTAVRNLITDLGLDILLYDSPAYKDHITRIVLSECNKIYHLFMERNPGFRGKISFVGHSLGSAIMFEILCRQGQPAKLKNKSSKPQKLDFEVEDFYALGSPIGIFQMLGGRTIAARPPTHQHRRGASSVANASLEDQLLGTVPSSKKHAEHLPHEMGENPVSRPKCAQIYNIFHPTDPIAYRLEPLISSAMASLKPQPLPYTKRGIFGAPVGQGLTGIGARVSQSVSSMWSSMASSLLTRGLGYADEPRPVPGAPQAAGKSSGPLSLGAGTNVAAGVVPQNGTQPANDTELARMADDKLDKMAAETEAAQRRGQNPPTLIDSEIETLYGDFEKRRRSISKDAETRDLGTSSEWAEAEERGKRLRKEEDKVRRLNGNGRVDYAIQEGAFDINLIAALASHLSYWSDEDVSHFIISQLLSRHRVARAQEGTEARTKT